MLSQALIDVCVPSYDLSKPGSYFFKRSYAFDETERWDVPMALVARATSAAPTYFDPARIGTDTALVDGGVFANNPAVSGYADALDVVASHPDIYADDVEIHVVSIGTGQPPQMAARGGAIPVRWSNANGWGLARWAGPVLEVVVDGVTPSTSVSARAAGTPSRSSPPRASSPACSGVCSRARPTTPTPSRR